MVLLCITNKCKKYNKGIEKAHSKVSGILFWGFWLRFLIEDSLVAEICVCCYFFNSNVAETAY